MKLIAKVLVLIVALEHIGILILEMFLWDGPIGQRIFSMTPEQSATSAVLAMNQGLYNGFLAAGLIWGAFANRYDIKIFFLGCVIVAGMFGAATAQGSILLTQAAPATVAMIFVILAHQKDLAGR